MALSVLRGNSSILKPGPYVYIFGFVHDLYLQKVSEFLQLIKSAKCPAMTLEIRSCWQSLSVNSKLSNPHSRHHRCLPAATHIYEIVPLGKQKAFYSNGDVSIGILFVMFLNTYGKNLWYKKKALLLL